MVTEVQPRRSELSDPAIANVDHIMLVFSLADPPFEPTTVTRFLVTAEQVRSRYSAVWRSHRNARDCSNLHHTIGFTF